MDPVVKEYRTKHKKCKWCKYYKYHIYEHWINCCYGECQLKDKVISFESLARLCKYYTLKQEELVIPTEEYKQMIQNFKIFIGGKENEKNK